ncbi:MAG: ABC transporter permease subunit [Leptospiraceae bacterium]|nr:ABC transporter permease subunit [Leptospiraceae bacterium]MCP5495402.1 ABC transporter permease subunit [Leptospiraceae bacterium]
MQNIKWIFYKELKIFFNSYMAPLVLGGTAFLNSLIIMIWNFSDRANYQVTVGATYLSFMTSIIVGMLILSMGSIVEEKNKGTMELLFSSPITDSDIVLGKYLFGVSICFIVSFVINAFFPFTLYYFWKIPLSIVISSTIGVFLLGCFTYSIGLFGSSMGKNQMISLLISVLIIMTLWVMGFFSHLFQAKTRSVLYHLHIYSHFVNFSRGVIPLSGTVFFLSGIFAFLYFTISSLQSRRWRG